MGLSRLELEGAGQEGGQLTWGLSQRKSGQKLHLANIESCAELNGQWHVVFDESIFFPKGPNAMAADCVQHQVKPHMCSQLCISTVAT